MVTGMAMVTDMESQKRSSFLLIDGFIHPHCSSIYCLKECLILDSSTSREL